MIKVVRNATTILFSAVTIINVVIFFYRDKFIYHKYATQSSLYSPDTLQWKKIVYNYPRQELDEAIIVLDSLADLKNKSTISKVLEIGQLLYKRFYRQRGIPSSELSRATPLNKFKILSNSDSAHLWCGDFASMFAFFCCAEGIPSRCIELINQGGHHVLNECFVSETGEWVLTDLMYNQLLLWDKTKDRYENLLHLRDSMPSLLMSLQATDSSVISRPFLNGFYDRFFGNKNPIYYYYQLNLSEVYKPTEKIKRYVLPFAWYEEVKQGAIGNLSFYCKQFFILLWLICFAFLMKKIIRPKKSDYYENFLQRSYFIHDGVYASKKEKSNIFW